MLNSKIYKFSYIISLTGLFLLTGCETTPVQSSQAMKKPIPLSTQSQLKTVPTPEGIKITPYDRPEIKREKIPVTVVPKQLNP